MINKGLNQNSFYIKNRINNKHFFFVKTFSCIKPKHCLLKTIEIKLYIKKLENYYSLDND